MAKKCEDKFKIIAREESRLKMEKEVLENEKSTFEYNRAIFES